MFAWKIEQVKIDLLKLVAALDDVARDEGNDPEQQLVENSSLDEIDQDEEDPRKRKGRRRVKGRYTFANIRGNFCYCKLPLLAYFRGDGPEEGEDEFKSDAVPFDAISDAEDPISEEVEEASSDPRKRRKRKVNWKGLVRSLFWRHLKTKVSCKCINKSSVAR